MANLNRYSYAGGNPVRRIDPSGRSWKSFENSFAHGRMGWQRWLQHLGNSDAWYSHVARLTAGMLLGPLQMVANPAGFAHAVLHDTDGMDIFLAAGVLSEGLAYHFEWGLVSTVAPQIVGGVSQSAAAAVDRSFKHFNSGTFVTGLEYTAGAELDTLLPRAAQEAHDRLAETIRPSSAERVGVGNSEAGTSNPSHPSDADKPIAREPTGADIPSVHAAPEQLEQLASDEQSEPERARRWSEAMSRDDQAHMVKDYTGQLDDLGRPIIRRPRIASAPMPDDLLYREYLPGASDFRH